MHQIMKQRWDDDFFTRLRVQNQRSDYKYLTLHYIIYITIHKFVTEA